MSNLSIALFSTSSVSWVQLTSDAKSFSELMAQEDQKVGPTNILSEALHSGFQMNCHGARIEYLLDRITLLARNLSSRVNEHDTGGYTPLMRAVEWGHLDVIENLLNRVPQDVDIDASAKLDAATTAAELAMIDTATPQWNALNRQVIAKAEWHALVYRPAVTRLVQDCARSDIILSYLFPLQEYKCLTAEQKAKKSRSDRPHWSKDASPCNPKVTIMTRNDMLRFRANLA